MRKFEILKNPKCNILVIGDVMIDQYYRGDVSRISPESPVPVFKYDGSYCRLGGASNVAANLSAIAKHVSLMSIVGNDSDGKKLKDILKDTNINYELVIEDSNRITTVKTRLLAQNKQQMIRIDKEDNVDISRKIEDDLVKKLELNIMKFDIVLISDYLKGLLTESFLQKVIKICNKNNKKVIIDIKGENLRKYKGAYLLKPNIKELSDIIKCKISNTNELVKAAQKLKIKTDAEAILVTCGENGMILIDEMNNTIHIPTTAKEVFDVTGAGDTVLSYFGYCIANGLSLRDSAEIANIAAGIKVGKVGTSVVNIEEVEKYYNETSSNIRKVITAEEFLSLKNKYIDKMVVFTNGCFDILHVGHVRYLKKAAELGDILIVGINSDESVRRLKGEKRPIICQEDRIEMLSSMSFINHIIMFNEDTPYELIKYIQPNILVKGSDYDIEDVVGKDIVESNGGKVTLIPLVEGVSTTNIVEKILLGYN